MLNTTEAARFLGISEKEIKDLVEKGKLPAYQIAGTYLRFKLEQLESFKEGMGKIKPTADTNAKKIHFYDNVKDFLYFNDFYILAVFIVAFLIFIIVKNIS